MKMAAHTLPQDQKKVMVIVYHILYFQKEKITAFGLFFGGDIFFNPAAKQLFSEGEFHIFKDEKLRAEKYLISSLQSQKMYQKNLENYNIFNV